MVSALTWCTLYTILESEGVYEILMTKLTYTVKKISDIPVPSRDVTYKLSPGRKSLVCNIPAGDGNVANVFLQCVTEPCCTNTEKS